MKTAMVLGASGGIGQAISSKLVQEGFQVIGIGRDISKLNGNLTHAVRCNFSSPSSFEEMAIEIAQMVEEVNLWIYAAGEIQFRQTSQRGTDDWRRILDANLNGVHYSVNASLPLLAKDAHLFFIGAYADRLILPGLAAYAASKAALETYTAILDIELRDKKVVLVRPAAVDTPFWMNVPFKLPGNAITAENVADRILMAYERGLSGLLDL